MYGLDNASGVNVMPKLAPVSSATPLWFTEGGAGLAASYPGQDWFNMMQAELLGVLTAGGIKPEKGKLNQLTEAIKKIVNGAGFQPSGNYATSEALKSGLDVKLDKQSPVALSTLTVTRTNDYAGVKLEKKSGESATLETLPDSANGSLNIIYRDKAGKNVSVTTIPKKSGTMMHIGDCGIGNNGISGEGLVNNYSTPVGFYYVPEHLGGSPQGIGGNWAFIQAPTAYPTYRCQLAFSDRGGSSGSLFLRLFSAGKESDWARFYHDKNTKIDRNGNLKALNYPDELSDYPTGSPIPWPQSTAPAG